MKVGRPLSRPITSLLFVSRVAQAISLDLTSPGEEKYLLCAVTTPDDLYSLDQASC